MAQGPVAWPDGHAGSVCFLTTRDETRDPSVRRCQLARAGFGGRGRARTVATHPRRTVLLLERMSLCLGGWLETQLPERIMNAVADDRYSHVRIGATVVGGMES